MVMYESDGSTLTLSYENCVPGATEVIRDIKDAPIERADELHKKSTDEKVLTVSAKLGKKAEAEVVEAVEKFGFKRIKGLSFEIPTEDLSEQALLMR